MNIAIIGAGNVGGALGGSWARAGHTIVYGVRDPRADKTQALLAATGAGARAVLVGEAARGAEVVALATPWDATQAALTAAGDLSGKVLIDCTNPLRFTPGIGLELSIGISDSGGETVARWARDQSPVSAAAGSTGSALPRRSRARSLRAP